MCLARVSIPAGVFLAVAVLSGWPDRFSEREHIFSHLDSLFFSITLLFFLMEILG